MKGMVSDKSTEFRLMEHRFVAIMRDDPWHFCRLAKSIMLLLPGSTATRLKGAR
jgi:hypothetical protein